MSRGSSGIFRRSFRSLRKGRPAGAPKDERPRDMNLCCAPVPPICVVSKRHLMQMVSAPQADNSLGPLYRILFR